eukprot:SAG22_NODE_11765_length_470_cov_0.886792_2_plen_88_part_01
MIVLSDCSFTEIALSWTGVPSSQTVFFMLWPHPFALLIVLYAFSQLAGDLAMSRPGGGRSKKYVEDLTTMELVGLWGMECQTYNLWAI